MINLIPPIAKKRVVAEYWIRTVSMWAFLGGTSLFLIATLFIPINIYVTNQESLLITLLKNSETEQTNYQQNTELLTRANKQASLLLNTKSEYTLHELLPRLRAIAGRAISIDEVVLTQSKDPSLSIKGLAETRQSLVSFRDELEKLDEFLLVDLPINNLIKENDVPFAITVTLETNPPSL